MTTLQIKLAVAIEAQKSVSNAAKSLNISQPNASNYIKALEQEIGFEIFYRSKAGARVTEKGRIFLERARRILEEHKEIMDIRNHSDMFRLRLGSVNYLSAAEPFLKLCEEHREDAETDFCFLNVSIEEGMEELDKFNLDIVFAAATKAQIVGVINECKKKNLSMISLGRVPAVISVRKEHPVLSNGLCENLTQGSDAMKDYPYAAYRNLVSNSGPTGYNDTEFIRSKYIMYVDEVTVRLRLVASTNAFMLGITPSKGVNERYGLVSFPIPGVFLDAFCLIRKSDYEKREVLEYISLLKKELELI